MVLMVKSINLDGLVHSSSCEKLVSETAPHTGFQIQPHYNSCFRICSVESLLNKLSLYVLKDKL